MHHHAQHRPVRLVSLAAALLCATSGLLLAPLGTAQARPDPPAGSTAEALPTLPRGSTPGMVDVMVVLRTQAALPLPGPQSRAQRLRQVEQVLRDHASTSQRGILQLLRARQAGGAVDSVVPLWISNEVAVRATPAVIRELARRPDVLEVRPATTLQAPTLAAGTASQPEANLGVVGAPTLWAQGSRGQGVVVASLDTGVDATHPDLAGRWRGGTNSWYDPNGQHPTTPIDVNGHGTQVMGVMVGDGTGGHQVGMAPGAQWIAAKIFNDRGQATTTGIHLAFQWLLDPDRNPATADAPQVLDNSWTMSGTACDTQFQADLRSLRAAGLLPVFAAGNIGPLQGSVQSPANYPESFAVGATDNSDALYPYSSRGPSSCSGTTAPAVTAPGVSITTTDLYGGYAAETGTSMAAPHVAGALALLLGGRVGLSPQRQADALTLSAHDLGAPGPDSDFGYGRLDVPAADLWLGSVPDYTLSVSPGSVTATPGGSASYDLAVSGTNGFTDDVALEVSGLPAGVSGSPDPAVVSGGGGTSRLTLALAGTVAPGTYPLTVTGRSGALVRSAPATLVVPAPPDFSVALSPASSTAAPGATKVFTATVTASGGFGDVVTLSAGGVPSSVGTVSVSPTSIVAAGTAQVSVQVAASAPAGTTSLTVTATSGGIVHTATANLTVQVPSDFSLTASPTAFSVRAGTTAQVTLSVAGIGGFSGWVTLSATGVPSGSTSSFTVNPVAVPGTSVWRLRPGLFTTRGTYTVKMVGKSGALTHTVVVTVTVT